MAASYEYAVGSIKAKEKSLLTPQDLEVLMASESEQALIGHLRDKGYQGDSVADMIANRDRETWEYVGSLVEDMSLFAPLLYQNDLHNVKAVIKGVLTNRKVDGLLLSPATIDANEIRQAVESQRFDRLPAWIAPAAEEAFRIMAQENDARLGDAILDRAAMAAMLNAANGLGRPVQEYFRMQVFFNDIKVALRAARTGTTAAYLEAALCPVEGLDLPRLRTAALAGSEELIAYLKTLEVYGCRTAIEAFLKSPSAFERTVDDMLIAWMRLSRFSVEGVDTLYGYVLARQAESKVVHIIASGVRTGAGDLRERVRHLHG